MRLRQEIKEIVSELAIDYDRTSVDPDDVTTKIIQLFEKRIEELDEWIDATPRNKINQAVKNKEIDAKQYESFKIGFHEAIKMIRKEILK